MPKKSSQLPLIKPPRSNTKLWWITQASTYGGDLNYRKVERPFDSKKIVHAVFKANVGKSTYFTRSLYSVEKVLKRSCQRYGIRLKDFAINKNHIHVLFYCRARVQFLRFLRFFAAELGRKYKKVYQRLGLTPPKEFWQHRPFTRLVAWGKRSLKSVIKYFQQNRDEALGFVDYKPRKHRLSLFLEVWEMELARSNSS